MPINNNLDAAMTALQRTAIETALDTIITTLRTVGDIQLSAEERQNTPSVDDAREPYVNDCIGTLAVNFPTLAGQEITVARATNNWNTAKLIKAIRPKLNEMLDRADDLETNTEFVANRFMNDYYDNCLRFKDRNVAGAESGYDTLKGYYDRFGSQNTPTPPTT